MTDPMKEILTLNDVWFYYDGYAVLEGVNLSIKENDFLGVIGPNGGGKTTLLKIILGLLKPSRGDVRVFGGPVENVRGRIGYVPQFSTFDLDFPVKVFDVVLLGMLGKRGILRHFTSRDKLRAGEALKRVGLFEDKDKPVGKLSYGQRQRVFIARALVTDPELLLLDEPTSSVDPAIQSDFYELLMGLKKSMAIVLVTHDIAVISAHVEKVACLNRKLFYHDSKEIKEDDLKAVYGCSIEMIAHGVPHRVMKEHNGK
ncbi:MAG: metal ABC transporter ATP-binding protein [Candidatus Omnitrophota bacterium]